MPVEERHGEANTRREGRPVQRRSLGSPSRDRANRRTPRTAPWLLGSHMPTWPGRCESRLTSYGVAQRWAHELPARCAVNFIIACAPDCSMCMLGARPHYPFPTTEPSPSDDWRTADEARTLTMSSKTAGT